MHDVGHRAIRLPQHLVLQHSTSLPSLMWDFDLRTVFCEVFAQTDKGFV
jgi:hypothetical protein